MVNARAKGQRGEREVVKLLQPVVNRIYGEHGLAVVDLERNLMQSRNGGYDIVGLDWLALEVKRHEKVIQSGVNGWWAQTLRQCQAGQEPVLFFRPNQLQWTVRMLGYLCIGPNGGQRVRSTVTVDIATFMVWFELRLRYELSKKINP